MLSKVMRLGAAAIFATVGMVGPAFAHGETIKAEPADGDVVSEVPLKVTVDLTEPPTKGAKFTVVDGCGRNVSEHVAIEGKELTAHLGEAQPGKWKASYLIISTVDGHPSESSWNFRVNGKTDCSEKAATSTNTEESTGESDATTNDDDAGASDGDANEAAPQPTSDEAGSPLVPVAIAAVLLIGVALTVRRLSARS